MKSCEISFEILKSNQNPEILIKILKSLLKSWAKKEDFEILSVILLGCWPLEIVYEISKSLDFTIFKI